MIHEFRSGSIGRISLETPDEFALWRTQALAREARRREIQREQAAAGPSAGGRRPPSRKPGLGQKRRS